MNQTHSSFILPPSSFLGLAFILCSCIAPPAQASWPVDRSPHAHRRPSIMTTADTSSPPSSSSAPQARPPHSRVPVIIVILLVLIAGAIGAGVMYVVVYKQPVEASRQQVHDNLIKMTGL